MFRVTVATLVVAVIATIPAYFIFWHQADVVYDKRAVEIPLSDPLRKIIEDALAHQSSVRVSTSVTVAKNRVEVASSGPQLPSTKLPDKLLYVNIRNVGHVPSSIRVRITVPGLIADKDLTGAGPAFGAIGQQSISDEEISFECPHLANQEQAQIKIAVWYQQTKAGTPVVEVEDTSEGPAREVGSIDTASFQWVRHQETVLQVLGVLGGVLAGGLLGWQLEHRLHVVRKAIRMGTTPELDSPPDKAHPREREKHRLV